jgi:hypothetical protein
VLDKLLVGLPSSFSSICTTLCAKYSDSEFLLKHAISELLEFEHHKGLTPPSQLPANISPSSKHIQTLTAMLTSSHRPTHLHPYKDFNWLNSENQEGVCFRCGKSGHAAPHCIYDMPKEVKDRILASSTVKLPKTEDVFFFCDSIDLECLDRRISPSVIQSIDSVTSNYCLPADPIVSIVEPQIYAAHFMAYPSRPSSPHPHCSPTIRGGRRSSWSTGSDTGNLIISEPTWLTSNFIKNHPDWDYED